MGIRFRLHFPIVIAAVLAIILYLIMPDTAAASTIPPQHKPAALAPLGITQVITATKTDIIIIDGDNDNAADAGDTLEYTIVITNTGVTSATNILFTDTIDSNTTLSDTLQSTPLALPDSYEVIGNTPIVISAGNGVLAGTQSPYGADNDPDGGTVTVNAVTNAPTSNGGTISLAADGSFTYTPPLGFEGTDTVEYTITDDEGQTDSDTITFTISDMVWYIDNTAAAGDGSQATPFNSLSNFMTAQTAGNADSPEAGDIIFIYQGDGTATNLDTGLTLLNDQQLIGQAVDLATAAGLTSPLGTTLPTATAPPLLTNSGGTAVTLAQNNTLNGFTVGSTASYAIAGTSVGTASARNITVNGTGELININGGTLDMLFDALTTTSATATAINLQNLAATSQFTATAASLTGLSGTGLNIATSPNATFSFGSLTINATNATGINATGGGMLNINGTSNTINSGSATAANINGLALNVTLSRIDSSGGSAVGLSLVDTTGSFTLTGGGTAGANCNSNSANCTGGTIQNKTGNAIILNRATNVSLSGLFVNNISNDGLLGGSTTAGDFLNGFTLRNSLFQNIGDAVEEHGLEFRDLHGTATFENVRVTNTFEDGLRLFNNSGSLTSLTMTNVEIDNANGGSGLNLEALATASITGVTISSSNFHDNFGTGLFLVNNSTGGTLAVTSIDSNTFTNNNIALDISAGPFNNTTTFNVLNNTTITGHNSHAMNFFSGDTAGDTSTNIFEGTISGNVIGDGSTAGSGSAIGNGIRVNMNDPVDTAIAITNNQVRNVEFGRGIEIVGRLGTGNTALTILNNTISDPGSSALAGLYVESNDGHTVCANISGNTVAGGPYSAFPPGGAIGGDVLLLEGGLGGGSTHQHEGTAANAVTQFNNTNTATNGVVHEVDQSGNEVTNIAIVSAGTCDTPTPPTLLSNHAPAVAPLSPAAKTTSESTTAAQPNPSITIIWANNDALTLPTKNGRTAKPALLPPLSGETVNLTISNLPPGKTITLTLQATIDNPVTGGAAEVCNQATLTAAGGTNLVTDDPATAAPSDPTCTLLDIEADLQISKTSVQTTAIPGTPISYTLTITNAGPDIVIDALVSDTLPAILSSASWSCGATTNGATCDTLSGTGDISTTVDLPLNSGLTFTLTADIDPAATGSFSNTATITSTISDPNLTNNTSSHTDLLAPQANLSIEKIDLQDPVPANGNVTYVITVTNSGPSDATSVTVNDTLPVSLTLTNTSGCAEDPNGVPACSLGTVAASATTSYTITTTVNSGVDNQLLTNSATVSAATTDPLTADNTVTETTTVGFVNTPPALSINDVTVDETAGSATFTITLSAVSPLDATATVSTTNGTATAGADYTGITTTITITAGQTTTTVTVPILGDFLDEDDETFTATLANPNYATLGDSTGLATITDDDPLPTLTINDVTVSEPDGSATFTVTLSAVSGRTVSVAYATSDDSATAGSDYTNSSGTLTLPAGQTEITFTVPILNDTALENSETFTVTLSTPTNATLSDDTGIGTITDDDPAPTLSINDVTISEEDGTATFDVTLSAVSGLDTTATVSTTNDTATAGADYTALNTTLTITAGLSNGNITIPILEDTLYENSETFTVTLSTPTNATLSDDTGIGTITDNDPIPALIISDVTVDEPDGTATFTVTLSAVSGLDVTATFSTTNSSATAGSDYAAVTTVFTIPAGTTQTTLPVTIFDDGDAEGTETFTALLTTPTNATITDDTATATILDDDGLVYLPLVAHQPRPDGPDLIVQSINATTSSVDIVITNIGNEPADGSFWVDFYINPPMPPTGPNQTIDNLNVNGLVWGVIDVVLQPGEILLLTVDGPYYNADFSKATFPLTAGLPVYAQVDSANAGVSYGAILESHEISGAPYNNISSSTITP